MFAEALSSPAVAERRLDAVVAATGPAPFTGLRAGDAGFELLGWFNVGWANFFTKTEIRTPDELKKAKMGFSGISSPGLMAAFKSAGFTMEDVPGEKMLQSIKSMSKPW